PTIPGVLIGGGSQTNSAPTFPGPIITRNTPAQHLSQGTGPLASVAPGGSAGGSTGGAPTSPSTGPTIIPENRWSLPYSIPSKPIKAPLNSPLIQFTYYPLYTLDYIQGSVLFDGGYQLATLDGNVDLRAQVKNATGVSFSWNTTNLTHATGITTSGTGNYDLMFTWATSNAT